MKHKILILSLLVYLSSCRLYYTGHIMFQTDGSVVVDSSAFSTSVNNYVIQPNDRLDIRVSLNNGEMLLDPDNLIRLELNAGMMVQGSSENIQYIVQQDGTIKLPLVGYVNLQGLNQDAAEKLLQEKYFEFYSDAFVKLSIINRRVVVFGSNGGQVIPLESDKMTLIEAIALSGEVNRMSLAHNIRLIRGDLKNPNVIVVDLSTIEGMRKANLALQPNDIIYVEPKRQLFSEVLSQNIYPILGLISSITTLVILVTRPSGN